MDDLAKNLLLFALGVGAAIALFYVWERLPQKCNAVTSKTASNIVPMPVYASKGN